MWLCAGLCTLCVLTGLFFLFFDDARSGNYFALGVKIVGTLLCVLTGAVVILCSMIAQGINQRIDPRQRASQGEVTAL